METEFLRVTVNNTLSHLVISFWLAAQSLPAESDRQLGSDTATNSVAAILTAFEEGRISWAQVKIDDSQEQRRQAIDYFLSSSNAVPSKGKLILSKCFFLEGNFTNAFQLAEQYTEIHSEDWRGWSMLGAASVKLSDFDNAVRAYTNAVMRGDEDSYAPLAVVAVATDRLDVVRDIVPHLLILKRPYRTRQNMRMQIVAALVMYSANANQEDVFIKALEDVSESEILARTDVTKAVLIGWRHFQSPEVKGLCEAVQRKSGDLQPDRVSNAQQ